MFWIFVFLSALLGLVGLFNLSQATLGVGLICLAVLAAIWARLMQADNLYERERKAFDDTMRRNS